MVYVFLADGFEEIEALSVVDILRRAEIPTKTVGLQDVTVRGAHGITVMADTDITAPIKRDITAAVLPGGMPGTLNLSKSEKLKDILMYSADNDIILAAICAAPSVLGSLGLLRGKCATCYPGFQNYLISADYKEIPVCVDGNILTAYGPAAAVDFALELVRLIRGDITADKINEDMRCY